VDWVVLEPDGTLSIISSGREWGCGWAMTDVDGTADRT
jgi:hypothetical protein